MILDVFVGGVEKQDSKEISYAIENRKGKKKGLDSHIIYYTKEDCSESIENVYLLSVLHAFRKIEQLKKDKIDKVFVWMDLQEQKSFFKHRGMSKQIESIKERKLWEEVHNIKERLAKQINIVTFSGLPTNDLYCRKRLSDLMEKEIVGVDLNRRDSVDMIDKNINTIVRLESPNKVIRDNINKITAYTDGSINGNDNDRRTGYGIVIEGSGRELFKVKGRIETQVKENIQFVELYSIYRAMSFINKKIKEGVFDKDIKVEIKSDNLQSINILNEEVQERAIENLLLIDKISQIRGKVDYTFSWVKGHADNEFNNMADLAAKKGSKLEKSEEVIFQHTEIVSSRKPKLR